MTRKRRRLTLIGAAAVVLAIALGLVLFALRDTIVFFNSPSDVISNAVKPGTRLRLGGLVAPGSVVRDNELDMHFQVTDGNHSIGVAYHGILPDLFREGQGVVAAGALNSTGVFAATEVLAKHDERYMPPEVVDALKRAGRWKEKGS